MTLSLSMLCKPVPRRVNRSICSRPCSLTNIENSNSILVVACYMVYNVCVLPPRGVFTSSTLFTAAIRLGVAAPRPSAIVLSFVCDFCTLCFFSVAISSLARACGEGGGSALASPPWIPCCGDCMTGAGAGAGAAAGLLEPAA
jgi:hypothetical protein